MKKLFALVLISLFVVSCKTSNNKTVSLTEIENTPVTRIQIIDGYELVYEKTGFLKIKRHSNDWLEIIQTTEKGISKNKVRLGEYANVIIEEFPSIYEVPAIPEQHSDHWPSREDIE